MHEHLTFIDNVGNRLNSYIVWHVTRNLGKYVRGTKVNLYHQIGGSKGLMATGEVISTLGFYTKNFETVDDLFCKLVWVPDVKTAKTLLYNRFKADVENWQTEQFQLIAIEILERKMKVPFNV